MALMNLLLPLPPRSLWLHSCLFFSPLSLVVVFNFFGFSLYHGLGFGEGIIMVWTSRIHGYSYDGMFNELMMAFKTNAAFD